MYLKIVRGELSRKTNIKVTTILPGFIDTDIAEDMQRFPHVISAAVVDFVELAKPRIVVMVMLTVAAGFWLAGPAPEQAMILFHVLAGTMLVASGTNALNQVNERDRDALMRFRRA